MLVEVAKAFMTEAEAEVYRKSADVPLRNLEETVYHKLLADAYGGSRVVLDNVTRWADRPNHAADIFNG